MNARLPRITVVTICRNVLPALRRTVASVLAQGYPELEYWIVDGASTDGTRAYLAELEPHGVRILSEPDRGISDAMNKGVRLATGEWVAHLHADDEYLPGALATVGRAALEGDTDLLCGWMIQREPTGDVLCRTAPERLEIEMAVPHPPTFTRRVLFERLGGFDTALRNAMDYDFFLRAHLAGARFRVVREPLVVVASGGQSERSLWDTLLETHRIRRRLLRSGWSRSRAFLAFLLVKGTVRQLLQRAGLAHLVAWYRRHLSIPRKG
ncbi:MAG: glycosyltransferase [Candidatus Eisenbacteria bacterium]|nr:glycosyltransferase [Candidatus Eisenbacteria bacterium]